ncbi:von Willebrand factor type A domain-containing protein [Neorhodopirellula lusitana]|uniref:Integrator complex subunit 14 n=1 Tax=Neorhodopirellula lusitana TaxID=445327 RepID=A0ABY1Q846_9BACT|nr:BatA and WFA domain-containing protein [Neorhodopirellula lusitana]SMP58530.1 von Willebrand factor type A domain-containing protein [Neorhodopirellula lusitana]
MIAVSCQLAQLNFTPALTGTWPWLVLGAVPIGIVLLYFLKLRREPVEVPSTYLWSRTIEDLHVNSLLQRLRNSVLLFLQLAAVVLVGLALFRPGVRDESASLGRLVFLLDASASMQAPAGGPPSANNTEQTESQPNNSQLNAANANDSGQSRFEQAVEQIGGRIDSMTDEETAMLIVFSDRAEVMQAFTSDRNRLRDALERCEVTNRPTDILGALKAADGLANPRRTSQIDDIGDVQVADALPAELLLYSDGGFEQVTDFNLGNLQPTYHAIGSEQTKNLSIVSFSANRDLNDSTQVEAFATIVNTGQQSASGEASLFLDGQLIDAASVSLEPGDQTGLAFGVESEDSIRLRLELDVNDDLRLDNLAYAALTPSGLVSVLVVTEGNRPLELGLTTEKIKRIAECEFVSPDFLKTDAYTKRAIAGQDDLIIFDRCQPPSLPATSTFFIGTLPNDAWSYTSEPSSLTLIDVDRTHPVLRYLELYSLLVFSGRGIDGPEGTLDLIESDRGTVMAIAPRGSYRDLVLGFDLVSETEDGGTQANTNWYAERSWPVFLLNLLRQIAGASASTAAPSYRPGEMVLTRLESAIREVSLVRIGQDDQEQTLDSLLVADGGAVEISQTQELGNYQLVRKTDGEAAPVVDRFAINLFDTRESNLATKPDIELGYETVEATETGIETRREYWRLLLVVVLAILAIEWWVYTRRLA